MLTIISFFSFLFLFIVLRHAMPHGILFYQGIALCSAISLTQLSISTIPFAKKRHGASPKDSLITLLLTYAFLITIPTNADRSFSVKMIEHLASEPNGMEKREIIQFYINDFVSGGGLDKRLSEQIKTGSLIEREGRYRLTWKGDSLSKLFVTTCLLFVCSTQDSHNSPTIADTSGNSGRTRSHDN
jgi:hypothetical protein